MRKNKVILVLVLSLILTGCTINKNSKVQKETKNIKVQSQLEENSVISEIENSNLSNIITTKKEVISIKSNAGTPNFEARNKAISEEYIKAITIVKEFCKNNSLEIKYVQPISDRISSLSDLSDDEHYLLLKNLENLGAETIQYFTDEESLNIDLSINTTEAANYVDDSFVVFGKTYSDVVYKASIQNVNENFKFKDSKLDEFRNIILKDKILDYDKLNDYIKNIYSGEYDSNTVFLNKIDDDKYEVIRIENNNCYYKLVYDPVF
ncbi:hypothetical protein [uncultured Clostridium sp.]|uniref:hypothetical protein n=1 Tax=uncultured Clostridium sp. TaxID=59620 RepID=UPI0025EE566A|nr:hypothetical protein [uncultured Clostridium sp.]